MRYQIHMILPTPENPQGSWFCQLDEGTKAQYWWLIAPAPQRKALL